MLFCPHCGVTLLAETGISTSSSLSSHASSLAFYCPVCPYVCGITKPIAQTHTRETKTVDDVLGGASAWENVDQTTVQCPQCPNTRAYFMQLQIRSADEPMTTFYKCTEHACGHQWREG